MKELNLKPGSPISFQGDEYTIKHLLDLNFLLALDENGAPKRLKISEVSPIPDEDKNGKNQYPDLVNIDEERWSIAKERFSIIEPILNNRGDGELIEEIAEENDISTSTLYRWINKYDSTGYISALAPQKRSGGKGKSRLSDEVEEIIQSTINDYYLSKQRRSIQRTCIEVINRCSNAELEAPHPNTVRNRIKKLSEYKRLKRRKGYKSAQQQFKPIKDSFPGGTHPLSDVQIDHTKLDILVVDEIDRVTIGRPWITLAIDVYSRMVLGFYISLDPPGAMGTGLCLSNAILPKEKWLAKMDIAEEWPCWGFMNTIHADNAKEFRGKMLARACKQYNMELNWRPVATPHWGGHIERYLGTIVKELHNVPGTTFSNTQERDNYKSHKKAVLTLAELEKWLTTFIVKIYHKREHGSLNMSPIEKYEEGIFGSNSQPGRGLPPKPLNERKIRLDFMPYEKRTIQRYGIVIDNINYYDDVLRPWINATEVDAKSKRKRKFIFKRDPRDISIVYFYDPELKKYFEIPYRDRSNPPMSIWEYNKVVRKIKDNGYEGRLDEHQIFQAYDELKEIEEKASKQTRRARRSKSSHKKSIHNMLGKEINTSSIIFEEDEEQEPIKPFQDIEHGSS